MKTKLVLLVLNILLILTLYGIEPLATYADSIIANIKSIDIAKAIRTEPKPSDPCKVTIKGKVYTLTEVKKWIDEGSQELVFNAKHPPYVLSIGTGQRTSNLDASFYPFVYHEDNSMGGLILGLPRTIDNGAYIYQLKNEGKYIIKITSSGCKWYAKVCR